MSFTRHWFGLIVVSISMLCLGLPVRAQATVAIDQAFSRSYWRNDGMRSLGLLESAAFEHDGRLVQYFEKARLEDHRAAVRDPQWVVTYGRVVAELMQQAPDLPLNGTNHTYGSLAALAVMENPPPDFQGGIRVVVGGVFVPFSPDLSPGPGFVVADVFWHYLNQSAYMPGGWLHDLGLPLTPASTALAIKADGQREVLIQAFERGVLTYDPANPPDWQVERANVGSDALVAQGMVPLHIQPVLQDGPPSIEVDLSKQWLYVYNGDVQVFDAPVSTGKDGFETPTGVFAIYRKYEVRTMRGSEGGETWVVPDVPHVMFFYRDFALHGTYWHHRFGTGARLSHGCVNLPLDAARWLYALPNGTPVMILP